MGCMSFLPDLFLRTQRIFIDPADLSGGAAHRRGNIPPDRGGSVLILGKKYRISLEDPVTRRQRRIQIHSALIALIVCLGTALTTGAVVSFFIAHRAVTQLSAHRLEIETLREENQAQQIHIQQFSDRVGRLSGQLAKLQNYYARLKVLTQLDLEDYTHPAAATGGPQPREFEMDVYLEKSLKRNLRRIHWELEELQMEAEIQEQNAHRIENFFDSQRSLLTATPTIWPVRGWISSLFGYRISPFSGELQMHEGIDIGSREGTPVKATADGIVTYAGWKGDYGKMVALDHGYGFRTRYGHMDLIYVRNGQRVKRGTTIGTVGNTGRSTGPHLHYEVKLNRVAINPAAYLLN
jgi:murein DD-endopeptidase MepM/ murein hydrolase activator NlpD